MYMTPLSSSEIEAYNASSNTAKNGMDPEASQDRFLKLLVAQLNNQDPMNPMDNAQMTTQMAQINTVSGIQEMNKTLKGMADQFTAAQSMQGVSLAGHDVLVAGNTLTVNDGKAQGSFDLSGLATSVKVDVLGKAGEVLATVPLGAMSAGRQSFTWEAGTVDPAKVAAFRVNAVQGDTSVPATPLAQVRVRSVSFLDGAMKLHTSDGKSVGYADVKAFM